MNPEPVDEAAREQLAEHVQEDPDLTPGEKEFGVNFTKADDRAHVYCEIAGPARRLLVHPEAEIDSLRVSDEERFGARVPPAEYSTGRITGVEATVPIGILKLRTSSRTASGWAEIVSEARDRDRGEDDA